MIIILLTGIVMASVPEPDSQASGVVLTMAELIGGDRAGYGQGSLRVAVLGVGEATDRSARVVPTLDVAVEDHGIAYIERLNLTTLRIETVQQLCPVTTAGECDPWVGHSWLPQGTAGLLGASILSGRQVAVGDVIELAGICTMCPQPFILRTEAPAPDGPPGAVLRLHIPEIPHALPPRVLHMGRDHAFPLMIQMAGAPNITLDSFERGDGARYGVESGAPSFGPLLASVPYSANMPAEGEPFPGELSWAEVASHFGDAAARPEEAEVAHITYFHQEATTRAQDVQVRDWQELQWSIQWRDGSDHKFTFSRHDVLPDLLPSNGVTSVWSVRDELPADLTVGEPRQTSVRLWDAVRLASQIGGFEDFSAFQYTRAGWTPHSIITTGKIYGLGLAESVTVDADTGLLLEAHLPIGRIP